MAQAVKFSRRRALDPYEEERREMMEGMVRTRNELNQAYAQFNAYSDPDLVEACVYQINALRSRYSYFVRQIKRLETRQEDAG